MDVSTPLIVYWSCTPCMSVLLFPQPLVIMIIPLPLITQILSHRLPFIITLSIYLLCCMFAMTGSLPGDVMVAKGSAHPALYFDTIIVRANKMNWIAGHPPYEIREQLRLLRESAYNNSKKTTTSISTSNSSIRSNSNCEANHVQDIAFQCTYKARYLQAFESCTVRVRLLEGSGEGSEGLFRVSDNETAALNIKTATSACPADNVEHCVESEGRVELETEKEGEGKGDGEGEGDESYSKKTKKSLEEDLRILSFPRRRDMNSSISNIFSDSEFHRLSQDDIKPSSVSNQSKNKENFHNNCNDSEALDYELVVSLNQPQRAVTPGQILALYQGEECLGGGIISLPAVQQKILKII